MRIFHQIPLDSNRIYYGVGWGEHVAVRSIQFKSENLEVGDELQYTDVDRSEPISKWVARVVNGQR
jgi:hypothetical protein